MSRYRRLRGMVRYVVPVLRRKMPDGRKLIDNPDLTGDRRSGYCRWCGLPVQDRRRRLWDADCERQFRVCIGQVVFPTTYLKGRCAECGQGPGSLEIEHRLPIYRARQAGVKALVAAFLLENLQWMCHACHVAKTTKERREDALMRKLESGEISMVNPKVTCPECGNAMMVGRVDTDGAVMSGREPGGVRRLVCTALGCHNMVDLPPDLEAQVDARPRLFE